MDQTGDAVTIDFQAILAAQEAEAAAATADAPPQSMAETLSKTGEARVMGIETWLDELGEGGAWTWESSPPPPRAVGGGGSAQATAPGEGYDLVLGGGGTFLRDLPGLDLIEASRGGLALELQLAPPRAGVAAGLVLNIGDASHGAVRLLLEGLADTADGAGPRECRVTLSSAAPPSGEEEAGPAAAAAVAWTTRSEKWVPAKAMFMMRLELEPGGRGVAGFVGANENCLRIVGRADLQEAALGTCKRGGLAVVSRATEVEASTASAGGEEQLTTRFGTLTMDVLAADRLAIGGNNGGGGGGENWVDIAAVMGANDSASERGTAGAAGNGGSGIGSSWTFSPDLSASDMEDIQRMIGVARLGSESSSSSSSSSSSPPAAAPFEVIAPAPEENGGGGGEAEAQQAPAEGWTISSELSPDRRAEIMALIGGAAPAPAYEVSAEAAAEATPPASVNAAGWKISESLSPEERQRVMAMIASGMGDVS